MAASSASPRCGTPSALARRRVWLRMPAKILRQVDAQHRRPFLFKQGESGLRAERCGKDQIGMQAQNSLSRGAHDRELGGLVRDEGQGGIARER